MMNLQYEEPVTPVRLLIVNPLSKAGALLCIKGLRGVLFGSYRMVELKLLVYANEMERANQLKFQLDSCGFPFNNGITVTSDVPSMSDADVFVFLTGFSSLNYMDFDHMNEDVNFDSLYLLLKIANNLEIPLPPPPPEIPVVEPLAKIKQNQKPQPKLIRPMIVADGLLALNIVKIFSRNLPSDIFFCPSAPLSSISKGIIADKLGVRCDEINYEYVWAANNRVFHIEIELPLYIKEKNTDRESCEWDGMAKREYHDLQLDSLQFNAGWLKKDFLYKMARTCENQPVGELFKTAQITKVMKHVWLTRRAIDPEPFVKINLGVISDGSLGTHKGLPYILPVILEKETYKVNLYHEDDYHLKLELQRINKAVLEHHRKVKEYCKKFLENNVINMNFLPKDSTSQSTNFISSPSSSSDRK